ncbi:MAG: hypothetical protein AAB799_00805 [Patescibacteria group bacterium]
MTVELVRRLEGVPRPWIPFARDNESEGRKRYPRVMLELSEEQVEKIRDAIGDGTNWPKHTDDPYVNFAVDCLVSVEWHERPSFDEIGHLYVEEIEAFKAAGISPTV